MYVEPIRRSRRRPVAIVHPGWNTLIVVTKGTERTVKGREACWEALAALEKHQVYVTKSLKGLLHCTGSRCWQAEVWRGKATSMTLDGTKTKVTSLRGTLDDAGTLSEQFQALDGVVEWLAEQGVCAGAISSMAWNLWRSTLTSKVELAFDAKIGRAALYGGRQEAREARSYQHMVALDISSAYPHSMGQRPYGGTMREVSNLTQIDPTTAGIARAVVSIDPELPYPPLPMRVAQDMIQFQRGILRGTWTWGEIHAASQLGCKVTIERSWAPNREVNCFGPWFDLVARGRGEVGAGAPLLKAISNSLWGMFGMTGDDRGVVRWHDDLGQEPELVQKSSRRMPQASCAHIAAETTSRVRVRLLAEGLYGDEVYPIHVDTDGIIVRKSSAARRVVGSGIGDWRIKTEMPRIELRGPQWYRYRCGPGCGRDHADWHYVAAGMTQSQAERAFTATPGFRISVGGLDSVAPSGFFDPDELRTFAREKEMAEMAIFGSPLVVER
jgi:hypothetical protein